MNGYYITVKFNKGSLYCLWYYYLYRKYRLLSGSLQNGLLVALSLYQNMLRWNGYFMLELTAPEAKILVFLALLSDDSRNRDNTHILS